MTKPCVMIVEDDPTQNQIFELTLKSDFEVKTFVDGDSALSYLKTASPALLVLDLNLPGKPGKDILVQVRADSRMAKTRIILTTADEQQADFLFDQVDMVLLKPISPAQLKDLALRLCPTN